MSLTLLPHPGQCQRLSTAGGVGVGGWGGWKGGSSQFRLMYLTSLEVIFECLYSFCG